MPKKINLELFLKNTFKHYAKWSPNIYRIKTFEKDQVLRKYLFICHLSSEKLYQKLSPLELEKAWNKSSNNAQSTLSWKHKPFQDVSLG